MIRRFCIPVALAAAVALGYLAFVTPKSSGSDVIDIAFIGSVITFLVLLVSVLGDQLKRTSDPDRAEKKRDSDA